MMLTWQHGVKFISFAFLLDSRQTCLFAYSRQVWLPPDKAAELINPAPSSWACLVPLTHHYMFMMKHVAAW